MISCFHVRNLKKSPAGVEKVDITYRMDVNGLLQVCVKDVRSGNSESLTITRESLNLPREEIERLIEEGEFIRQRAAYLTRYLDTIRIEK